MILGPFGVPFSLEVEMQAERNFTREQWQAPVDKAIAEADGDL